jgi:hypothetical protein
MCCASRPPSARSAWRRWKRERQHLPDRPAPLGESSGHGRCPLAIALHNTPPSRWHTALRAEGDDARPSPARADSHQEGTPTSTVRSTSATSPHIVRMGEASGLDMGTWWGCQAAGKHGAQLSTTNKRSTAQCEKRVLTYAGIKQTGGPTCLS